MNTEKGKLNSKVWYDRLKNLIFRSILRAALVFMLVILTNLSLALAQGVEKFSSHGTLEGRALI